MLEKLRTAAEAIGTDVGALGMMLVDAGLVPLKQDLGESISLERLGQKLAIDARETPFDERPSFYRGLSEIQKAALICHLKNRGFSSVTIAREYEVGPAQITKLYNQYAQNIGANVLEMRQDTVAGLIQLQMEAAIERVRQLPSHDTGEGEFSYSEIDKEKLSWQIFREGQRMLRDIGVVADAPKKLDVSVSSRDISREDALKRLEELTEKENRRKIEIEKTNGQIPSE